MSIFKRMFRIGKANVNAALDKLEDPVKMIDQVLRELDEDIAKVTAAVTTQMAVEKRFERELKEAEEMVARREQQVRKALENGEDELARQALIDKKRHEEKRDSLKTNYEQAKANADKLRKKLHEMKDKVQEMKTQRSTLIAQAEAAKATQKINEAMNGIGNKGVGDTFARMQEKIQQMHDEADAAQRLADDNKSLDDQFEELMRSAEEKAIDDELAALKAELKQKEDLDDEESTT